MKQIELVSRSHPIAYADRVPICSDSYDALIELVATHSNDAVVIADAADNDLLGPPVLYVNEAFTRMTQYASDEINGQSLHLLRGADTDPETCDWIRARMRAFEGFRAEILNYRKDGVPFWVEIDVQPVRNSEDIVAYWVSIQREITERKCAEERLRQSEQHYQRLVAASPDCIKTLSLDGKILSINENGAAAMEADGPQALVGRDWTSFLAGESHTRAADAIQRAGRGETVQFQGFCATTRGTPKWWDVIISPLLDSSGAPEQLLAVARDVTIIKDLLIEQKRLLADANDRAKRDSLTGLYNYRVFHEALDRQAVRSVAADTSLAVLELDIDNFKSFNDAYGHLAGDTAIMQVARLLKRCAAAVDARRAYDVESEDKIMVSRVGGDEFAVLIPNASREDAEDFARDLKDGVDSLLYDSEPSDDPDVPDLGNARFIPFKISVGIALFPDDASSATEAYRLADERALRDKIGSHSFGNHELREALKAEVEGFATLDALVVAVDSKDRYTRRHSEDVMTYALMIASHFPMTDAERKSLTIAALVHDVGKISVPDRILRQPAGLSPGDRETVQKHVTVSAALVTSMPALAHTASAIKHHHERWDGGGYPDGLAGDDIPLSARILGVAEAYSAMTTDRPYRKGMSVSDTILTLEEGAGKQWDPDCVTAFVKAMCGAGRTAVR